MHMYASIEIVINSGLCPRFTSCNFGFVGGSHPFGSLGAATINWVHSLHRGHWGLGVWLACSPRPGWRETLRLQLGDVGCHGVWGHASSVTQPTA
eukprot:4568745-Amphidinium_carterae.1